MPDPVFVDYLPRSKDDTLKREVELWLQKVDNDTEHHWAICPKKWEVQTGGKYYNLDADYSNEFGTRVRDYKLWLDYIGIKCDRNFECVNGDWYIESGSTLPQPIEPVDLKSNPEWLDDVEVLQKKTKPKVIIPNRRPRKKMFR